MVKRVKRLWGAESFLQHPQGHGMGQSPVPAAEGLQHQDLHQCGPVKASGLVSQGLAQGGCQPRLPHRWIVVVPRHMPGRAALVPRVPVGITAGGAGGAFGDPAGCCCWAEGEALLHPHRTLSGLSVRGLLSIPIVFRGGLALAVPSGKPELAHGAPGSTRVQAELLRVL